MPASSSTIKLSRNSASIAEMMLNYTMNHAGQATRRNPERSRPPRKDAPCERLCGPGAFKRLAAGSVGVFYRRRYQLRPPRRPSSGWSCCSYWSPAGRQSSLRPDRTRRACRPYHLGDARVAQRAVQRVASLLHRGEGGLNRRVGAGILRDLGPQVALTLRGSARPPGLGSTGPRPRVPAWPPCARRPSWRSPHRRPCTGPPSKRSGRARPGTLRARWAM